MDSPDYKYVEASGAVVYIIREDLGPHLNYIKRA